MMLAKRLNQRSSPKVVQGLVFSLLAASVFSACASTPSSTQENKEGLPQWVSQSQSAYPDSRYLTAVGVGKTRTEAIQDARKNLAENFLVKVKSETQVNTQTRMNQNTQGDHSGETNSATEKNLTLVTETSLRSSEVKEVATVSNETYALIALDKLTARSGLLMEAEKSRVKLNSYIEGLQTRFQAKRFEDAKAELSKLEQLLGEAGALGMSALIPYAEYEAKLSKIDDARRAALRTVPFVIQNLNSKPQFLHEFEKCVSDAGGLVVEESQAPANAYKIKVEIVERPQHFSVEGWSKIRFDMTANVVQPGGKTSRIKASQTEQARSKEAAIEQAADGLAQEFCSQLFMSL